MDGGDTEERDFFIISDGSTVPIAVTVAVASIVDHFTYE